MFIYKVTYVNNAPLLCELSNNHTIKDSYVYETYNGMLIYALIKADDLTEAERTAKKIAEEVSKTATK